MDQSNYWFKDGDSVKHGSKSLQVSLLDSFENWSEWSGTWLGRLRRLSERSRGLRNGNSRGEVEAGGLKYTSNALGRLHRKGLLTATKVTRSDWRGIRRGYRYIYQISRKGHERLRFLEKRSWIPNLIYLGSCAGKDASEPIRLELLRGLLKLFQMESTEFIDHGPAKTDLGDFLAAIDPKLLGANVRSKILTTCFPTVAGPSYWPLLLQRQGLVPPEINVPVYRTFESRQGFSNKEILLTLLYRGAKRLAAENRVLKDRVLKDEPRSGTLGVVEVNA